MRTISLETIKNVRDLGEIPVAGGRMVKSGLLFRGSTLFDLNDADTAKLFGELGIRCVIDLRVGYERAAKPDPVVSGVENLFIPYYDNELVGYEYFKPLPGTITIGNDFACDPDDFYYDLANPLTAKQMKKALHAAFDHALAHKPVYLHCSNGKDRAGVTSLLILEILGAAPEDITADYLLTNASRQENIEATYRRFLRLCQGNKEFARRITDNHRARPKNLEIFRRSIAERYGSMEQFIRDVLDFSDENIAQLRSVLTK